MYLARFGTKNLLGLNSKCSVGFCQFYKIIKMIIKSIKVFVEWNFIPASSGPAGFGGLLIGAGVTGEGPETAPL